MVGQSGPLSRARLNVGNAQGTPHGPQPFVVCPTFHVTSTMPVDAAPRSFTHRGSKD
jgi:hypothetical protein